MVRKPLWIALALAVGVAVIWEAIRARGLDAGDAPPPIVAKAIDGREINLANDRGSVVLINFFASWCSPCAQEWPELGQLDREYGSQGLKVLGIASGDNETEAGVFARRDGTTFPIIADTERKFSKAYGADALPHTVIIGRDGKIAAILPGFMPGSNRLRDAVKQVLGNS